MQASRILPDLQCSLLCEDVRQEASGNFILVGVINVIRVPQLPVNGRLCLFNRWHSGLGQFKETVRILAPDQKTVLVKGEMRFELKETVFPSTNVNVFGVQFTAPGTYYVEVLVDDILKTRYPFVVAVVPPPGAQTQTASAPQQ
ncbi:MAG: DUF6941 family protein [Limisphaerales bacterium]